MTEYILKVKVFLPKNRDIFYHSFSTERLGLCFCLTKFKNSLRQRFEVLNNARFKMVWIDNEGDRISILDEVDLHLAMEMKATEVHIEVDVMNSIEKETNIDFPILSHGFQNVTTVRGSRDTSFEKKLDRGQFFSSVNETVKATSRDDNVPSSDCSSLKETKTITSIEPRCPMKISPHGKLIAPDTPMERTQVTQSFSGDDKSSKEVDGKATIVNKAPMSSSSSSYSLSEEEERETSNASKTPTKRSPHEKHISLKHCSSSEKEKNVTSFVTKIVTKIAHEKIPSYSSEGSSSEEKKGNITISPITPTKRSTDEKMITPDAMTKRTQKIQLCSSDISSSQEEGGQAIVVNKTPMSSSSYSSPEEKEERETLMEPKTKTKISSNEKHASARLDSSLENEKSITSDVTSSQLYDRFYNAMKSISLARQSTISSEKTNEKMPSSSSDNSSFEEMKGKTLILREQTTSNDDSSSEEQEEEGEELIVPETPTKVSSCHHNHVMSSPIEDSSSKEAEEKTSISPKTPMEGSPRERHISPKHDSSSEEKKTATSISPITPIEVTYEKTTPVTLPSSNHKISSRIETIIAKALFVPEILMQSVSSLNISLEDEEGRTCETPVTPPSSIGNISSRIETIITNAPFVHERLTQSASSLGSLLEDEEGKICEKRRSSSPTKRSPNEKHISPKHDSSSEEEKTISSITPILPIEAPFAPEILTQSASSLDSSLEEENGRTYEKNPLSSPTKKSPQESHISTTHDNSSEEEKSMTSITPIIPTEATHVKTTPVTPPSSNDNISSGKDTIIAKAPFVVEILTQSASSLDSSLEEGDGRTYEKNFSSSPTKRSPHERQISQKHDSSFQEENTMKSITPIIPIEATHEKTIPVAPSYSNDNISSQIETIITKLPFVPEMMTRSASSLDSSLEEKEGRTYDKNPSSSPTKRTAHERHISPKYDSSFKEENTNTLSITPIIPIEATHEKTTPVTPPSSNDKISSQIETIIAEPPFASEILTQGASSLDSSLEEEKRRTSEKNPSSSPTKRSPDERHATSSEEEVNTPIQTKQITSSNSMEERKTLISTKMPSFLRDDIPDEEEMMKRLSSAPSSSKTDHTTLKKLEEKELVTSSSKQHDEKTSTSPSKGRHNQKPLSSDGSSLAEGEESTSASSNEQPIEYLMKVSSENSVISSGCTSTFAVLQLETLKKLEKSKEEMEVSGENLSCSSDNSSTFEELKPPTVEKYSSLESLNEELQPEKSSKDDSFLSEYSLLSDDSDYAECE